MVIPIVLVAVTNLVSPAAPVVEYIVSKVMAKIHALGVAILAFMVPQVADLILIEL
jgi:hypothetical protein